MVVCSTRAKANPRSGCQATLRYLDDDVEDVHRLVVGDGDGIEPVNVT
jgi:hypothetical protein